MNYLKSALLILSLGLPAVVAAMSKDDHETLAYGLYEHIVHADTTHSSGDTLAVANWIADWLREEGFPDEDIHIVEYGETPQGVPKGNLVARLRSDNPTAKPVLLLAHLDVVEADPADWSDDINPMVLTSRDGYFYGRGSIDDKDEVAIHLANIIRIHREQLPLTRDIIVAFTADEEGGPHNGAQFLVNEHRELVDAAFAINEGGGGVISEGRYVSNSVQAAEKVYQSYTLEVTNPGGHSSLPRKDNAIFELAHALTRIQAYEFPVILNETTRAYFQGMSAIETGERAAMMKRLLEDPPAPEAVAWFADEPGINARLRTTCVATELEAGHAENALPQRARATVNCRVFPGGPVEEVRQTLVSVAATDNLTVTPVREALTSDASPLKDEVMGPIRSITNDMWPGAVVLPVMSTGATDGLFFRNAGIPVYGVNGIFVGGGDYRAHGRDERILERSFYEGLEFLYRLTRAVAVSEDNPEPGTSLQN